MIFEEFISQLGKVTLNFRKITNTDKFVNLERMNSTHALQKPVISKDKKIRNVVKKHQNKCTIGVANSLRDYLLAIGMVV